MSRSQITLGIRSSEGRKRLQVSTSASGTSLKSQIKAVLNIEEDFVVNGLHAGLASQYNCTIWSGGRGCGEKDAGP